MSNPKPKMSASYKAIFVLSIFMVFFVLLAGAATKSKASGVGMWIWGYTAWLMYKRRIPELVSFYKGVLWFDFIAAGLVIAILTFSDNDVSRYVEFSIVESLILFAIVISITYGLYIFFRNQNNSLLSDTSVANNHEIEDKYWEQSSRELDGVRHEATWARAVASSDGDDAKSKALYIKFRALELHRIENSSNSSLSSSYIAKTDFLKDDAKPNKFSFNFDSSIWTFIGVALIIGYALYVSRSKSNLYPTINSVPIPVVKESPTVPVSNSTIKSIEEVRSLCYVYWDGVKWNLGKTEGDNFSRFSRDKYGVVIVEAAIPKQMANELNLSIKVGDTITNSRFDEFIKSYWYQVEAICKF